MSMELTFRVGSDARTKRHQVAMAIILAAALVLLISLFVAIKAGINMERDVAAVARVENLGANSLAIYSATHNLAVAQAVQTVSNSAASSVGAAAAPQAVPSPTPSSQLPPPATLGAPSPTASTSPSNVASIFPPQDTAGVDWRNILQAMTNSHKSLAAEYPRLIKSMDPAWSAFVGNLNSSGNVNWQVADGLRGAGETFAFAIMRDAAYQRRLLTFAAIVGAAALLGALAVFARYLSEARSVEQALQARLREREVLLESTGEGICALNRDGDCTYVNTPAEEMLGYRAVELFGKNLHSVLRHSQRDGASMQSEDDPFVQAIHAGEICRCDEDTVWRRDGSALLVAYTCAPIRAGVNIKGAVVVFVDVTERKELETLRDDLNGMIVHDLRTPLTSLLTGLQTLGVAGDLDATQREFLEIAVQGGETLLSMVNDLLDISKLEAGSLKLDAEDVMPTDLVTLAMSQVAGLAARNGLRVAQRITPDLPSVTADRELVRRALVNLLGNAVKFTPRGGIVTVAAFYEESEQAVVFAVGDTGEGIPAQSVRRIFEKFGQVESRKAGHKMSTGLGLTFCKLVAESHGGRIWVESKLGKGSRFLFTIPSRSTSQVAELLAASSNLPSNSPPNTPIIEKTT